LGRATAALSVVARSAALPVILGARWLRLRQASPDVPISKTTVGLAAKIVADELFLVSEVLSAAIVTTRERGRLREELRLAVDFLDERGFLAAPAGYHAEPPPLADVRISRARALGIDHEHVCFESGFEPHAGEPGGERWGRYVENRTAHARLLRHPGRARPWIVCAPGFRMGDARVDFLGFGASWLHRVLGLNVAIPVLPFHGPRRVGRRGGDGFLTGDLLDTVHAQAQAVWDVRRLIRWLRDADGQPLGLYGVSLGAYTAGLVAALEDDLACVVAGVPASDWVSLVTGHAPRSLVRASQRLGFPWQDVGEILSVVSPLALVPRATRERRFVFAGTSDRLAPPEQALALWRHWQEPRIAWYAGSHVSYMVEPTVSAFLREAFEATGLIPKQRSRASAAR
jgi:hypothetical protein